MQTPIADFVRAYAKADGARFHMPGHKGKAFLGCEPYDITEITGADALYEAEGIIAESEKNAAKLFGTRATFYSTEGSSQCIRAMLFLAVRGWQGNGRPYVIAARNAHKAFLYAAALLDIDVVWLYPKKLHALCSCQILPEQLAAVLSEQKQPPAAVYVTSPDYLGGQLALGELARICHRHGTILAVDNAHGAYLHFMEERTHPMDVGADICCDSAHKTLPVLTGGAYLHIAKTAPKQLGEEARQALALFGSTSPSYLTLASLDLCNAYLAEHYRKRLSDTMESLAKLRGLLRGNGWRIEESDPLKLTVRMPDEDVRFRLMERLHGAGIAYEYADMEYLVFMVTPENDRADYDRLLGAMGMNDAPYQDKKEWSPVSCRQVCSVREAFFAPQERVKTEHAIGRVCGVPSVGCPPAVPIAAAGELIDENAAALLKYYGNDTVVVLR